MSLHLSAWNEPPLCLNEMDEKPDHLLRLCFGGIKADELGIELTPTQVQHKPNHVEWHGAEKHKLYTLIMIDPDSPSKEAPKYREYLHYHLINMKGHDPSTATVQADYIGAGPPEGTGFHRYVWLVYEQSGPMNCDEPILSSLSGAHRANFSTASFRAKYKLGAPVAGTCYLSQFDDYVTKLYENLGPIE